MNSSLQKHKRFFETKKSRNQDTKNQEPKHHETRKLFYFQVRGIPSTPQHTNIRIHGYPWMSMDRPWIMHGSYALVSNSCAIRPVGQLSHYLIDVFLADLVKVPKMILKVLQYVRKTKLAIWG